MIALDGKKIKQLDLQDEGVRERGLRVRDRSHLQDLYGSI
jgi:hypothetical protein